MYDFTKNEMEIIKDKIRQTKIGNKNPFILH